MTNQELGMSNIFSIDDQGQYIMLDDNNGMADRLYIDTTPIISGSDQWSRAIKIKWPSANARPENELLDMAMNKNAWGATKLDLYLTAGEERNKNRQAENDDVPGVLKFTDGTRRSFENRTLVCVVTSPLGRPLHTFQTRLELLEALRDTIKCHRSL
ncbi:hypothetical protein MY10362_005303 [Beauveria mimosiformis]